MQPLEILNNSNAPDRKSQGGITLLLLPGGVNPYANFYEKLLEWLTLYREGKISKERATEAVASICLNANHYTLYHIVDVWEDGKPVRRQVLRSARTLNHLLKEGYALLYRGIFAIPKEVWREYKQSYHNADTFKIFDLSRLTGLAPYVLIDIDRKAGAKEEHVRKLIKYLHRLGIYPEVWESANGGWHVYIHLIHSVKVLKEVENGEVVVKGKRHFLPYASDYRLKPVVEALKEICKKLAIPYDFVSFSHAVWLEGIPNPEKGGKASRKVLNGKVHTLKEVFEKLRPIWEGSLRKLAWEKLREKLEKAKKKPRPVSAGVLKLKPEGGSESNPVDYIQLNLKNGYITRLLNAGYELSEVKKELESSYTGDRKAFERAWKGAEDFISLTFKPLKNRPKPERKHKHYWEYIPLLHQALKENPELSLRVLSKKTGIPLSSLSVIFKSFSREQIINAPEEVSAFLKQCQKGGSKLSNEEAKKKGKEKWQAYFEEVLKQYLNRKPKQDRAGSGESLPPVRNVAVHLKEDGGVQIGYISITSFRREEVGYPSHPPRYSHRRGVSFRVSQEVEKLLTFAQNVQSLESLKKSLFRLLFGAWRSSLRGETRTYDLSRFNSFGAGFLEHLIELLVSLGHEPTAVPEPEEGEDWLFESFCRWETVCPEKEKPEERVFSSKEEALKFLEEVHGRYKVGDRVKLWVVAPNKEVVPYEFEKVVGKFLVVKKKNEKLIEGLIWQEKETWELKTIHWSRS